MEPVGQALTMVRQPVHGDQERRLLDRGLETRIEVGPIVLHQDVTGR